MGKSPCRASISIICLFAWLCLLIYPGAADAAEYVIESKTGGEVSQFPRSDLGLSNTRLFSQRVSIRAYDLTDDHTNDLSAHLGFRYRTDLSLDTGARESDHFYSQWNRPALDIGYVTYKPADTVELRAGRQWIVGPLGFRDFDGLKSRLEIPISPQINWSLLGFGGRDLQIGFDELSLDAFDRPGLPGRPDSSPETTGSHWLFGGMTSLGWRSGHRLTLQYSRSVGLGMTRETEGAGTDILHSERFGASMYLTPLDRLQFTGSGSYHSILDGFDSLEGSVTWFAPYRIAVTGGFDHNRPVFDSASIFNVFGGLPNRRGYAEISQYYESIETDLRLRTWVRQYYRESSAGSFQKGVGLAETTQFDSLGRDFRFSSSLQYERGESWADTGQFSADGSLEAIDILGESSVRGYGAVVVSQNPDENIYTGTAQTYGLSIETPLLYLFDFPAGQLNIAGRHTFSSTAPNYTRIFATLTFEHWPGGRGR